MHSALLAEGACLPQKLLGPSRSPAVEEQLLQLEKRKHCQKIKGSSFPEASEGPYYMARQTVVQLGDKDFHCKANLPLDCREKIQLTSCF